MIVLSKLGGGLRRTNHAATAVGGKIYSFGGFDGSLDYSESRPIDVFTLNMSTLRWEVLTYSDGGDPNNVPTMRYGHSAIDDGYLIYLWGGRRQEVNCNRLFIFDTRTNSWSAPEVQGTPPGPRDGHTCCISGDFMYIFGGFDEERQEFSDSVFRLDLTTLTWEHLPNLTTDAIKKDFLSCVPIGNKIYIWGGRSYSCPFYDSTLVELDTSMLTWSTPEVRGKPPIGRRSCSLVEVHGKVVIFGGYNDILDEHFNDFHIYNPATCTWNLVKTNGAEPPCPRRRQVVVAVNNYLYIFGGSCPLPEDSKKETHNYMELDDLIVIDTAQTLRSRSLFVVLDKQLNTARLTTALKKEIAYFTTDNDLEAQMAKLNVENGNENKEN